MKKLIHSIVLSLIGAGLACAAVPSLKVNVSDASGKSAYKGATDAKGAFATSALKPGNYVVQFNGNAPKGTTYAFVVSAGKKKVVANAIGADRLAGGGVAMKIEVGAGLNITGQVATEDKNSSAPLGKNGKPMVWIPKRLGSNMSAHWAESDSAEAKEAQTSSSYSTKNLQDKQAQGISPGGN